MENPDIIIADINRSALDALIERPYSYIFVKTFNRNKDRIIFFTSITVKKQNMEVSVSSHIKKKGRIRNAIKAGRLDYVNDLLRHTGA